MVDSLVGSYKFDRNDNFESFLAATGVPFIPRKMMVSVSPSVNISKEGNVWTVTFNVLFKSFSIQFELGKLFVEENPVSKEINKVMLFKQIEKKTSNYYLTSAWLRKIMGPLQSKQHMKSLELLQQGSFVQLMKDSLW